MSSHSGRVVVPEPAAKAFAEANNSPPYLPPALVITSDRPPMTNGRPWRVDAR